MILSPCITQVAAACTVSAPAIEQVIDGAHGRGAGPMGILAAEGWHAGSDNSHAPQWNVKYTRAV